MEKIRPGKGNFLMILRLMIQRNEIFPRFEKLFRVFFFIVMTGISKIDIFPCGVNQNFSEVFFSFEEICHFS
jgi:hypothetical protein